MKMQAGPDALNRRGAILAAALQCFNEYSVAAATISDIATRSDASVGSIYHHFGSKEGIAAALLADGLQSNAQQLEERLRRARSARQSVHALVASLVDWIAAHPDWARFIYTVSSGRLDPASRERLREVNAGYRRIIEDYFGPHMKAGAFRRLPEECLSSLVVGPVHDYARRWLNGQVAGDLASHVDVFADAAWRAVRNSGKRSR